ncbi:MAG: hypothetical protein R3E97_07590 [Candidatus Eisenbacteria bacterium]
MSIVRSTLIVSALSIALAACGNETSQPESDRGAPDLPDPATMQMDLGFFSDSGAFLGFADEEAAQRAFGGESTWAPGTAELGTAAGTTHWNWIAAVVHVTAVNLIVAEVLGPPSAAFGLALSAEPERIDQGTYLWEYVYQDGNETATIDLEGTWVSGGVDWALYVTGTVDGRELDHDLWYSGHSSSGGRTGYWIFSDLEADPTDVARLDWSRSLGETDLSFRIIDADHEDFGDHVAFSRNGADRRIEWSDHSEDRLFFVTWDLVTGAGSLEVPEYNEGERACWNEDQVDIACPAGGVSL